MKKRETNQATSEGNPQQVMEPTTGGQGGSAVGGLTSSPLKIRGTATINPDNSFDFTPSQQGEPVQRSVRKHRKSKVYETAGNDKQSMVCHLVVDKNAVDPAAEMFEDFKTLTSGMGAKLPPTLKGRTLMNDEEVKVVANSKGRIQISIDFDFTRELNMTQKLVTLIYKITQCLASNATYFAQQRRALARTSSAASATGE